MPLVSLIPQSTVPAPASADRLGAYRSRLERAGYRLATELPRDDPAGDAPATVALGATADRVRAAAGALVIVVDPARSYRPDDVLALVRRLDEGGLDLVVAARPRGRSGRPGAGLGDPDPGLFGLTRAAARRIAPSSGPFDARMARDLVAGAGGRWAEVPVAPLAETPLDRIRSAKRAADRRLGNVSRFVQFCGVGASGMVVDLSMYAALQTILARTWWGGRILLGSDPGGAPTTLAVATAAVLAIVTAMTWNFSLNRRLTFDDARPGSIARQYGRYALSNLIGCGVSLSFRLLLPTAIPFFGRHRLAAAVAGIVAATGISFTLARWFVFGSPTARPGPTRPRRGPATGPDRGDDRLQPAGVEPAAIPCSNRLN